MLTDIEIKEVLKPLVHPELGDNVVSLEMVEDITITDEAIRFNIVTRKPNDPFANKLKRFAVALVEEAFPAYQDKVTVFIKEPAKKEMKPKGTPIAESSPSNLGKVIAVSSAKGGVGKSTTTANLAVTLANMGFRVGLLDADVHGPSMPKMFNVEGYQPTGEKIGDTDYIVPAESYGVKINSIGFYIKPTDALVWRGAMATNAIKQLIHQTLWGELDFLLIDLPPGTGDVHLAVMSELKIDGVVIVSTPQKVALMDVVRGIEMFNSEKINVPVIGLIENMAWFTPAELPENRYYIFGKDGCKKLAEAYEVPLLGEIPIVQSICEGGDNGKPIALTNEIIKKQFTEVAHAVIRHVNS